jgi:hypothetical protein
VPQKAWPTPPNSQEAGRAPLQAESKPVPGPASGMTGNSAADDDIMAFYKAKEELLRRQAKQ